MVRWSGAGVSNGAGSEVALGMLLGATAIGVAGLIARVWVVAIFGLVLFASVAVGRWFEPAKQALAKYSHKSAFSAAVLALAFVSTIFLGVPPAIALPAALLLLGILDEFTIGRFVGS